MEVYLDVVFLTNLVMDFFILHILGHILKRKPGLLRLFAGALAGALGSCLFLPLYHFPGLLLLHGLLAVMMIRICFGVKMGGMLVQAVVTLYFTAFLCGGLFDLLSSDTPWTLHTFLFFAAASYGILSFGCLVRDYMKIRTSCLYKVRLSYRGKTLFTKGFYDTGNLLTDSGNNKPVSIVSRTLVKELLPEILYHRLESYEKTMTVPNREDWGNLNPHFLTFQALGTTSGLVLAITLDEICIQTQQETVRVPRPVLALSQEEFLQKKDYQILLNANLLEQQEV